ncbi:MAG: MotA/TolQ/ExbB proton channel family protein [Candidatus Omnitrophica bacterium]|nr:MotA/TolQ/ExbB proton channel family protein [Candidatus Omnitrophota bacterium]MDE2009608.1 MotA/TolQ/ExbB proton channel family protein [Candidatus Omnitrophota bacterium]MDE2214464.1 MotA/TolQ/ExbB proton channel family protein [Candidatus Omnitrophota bacterium]MDE2231604.1 MotA/TolQ/ExbB proton channel family protein [Candidatus Omnitrophota bacterium]
MFQNKNIFEIISAGGATIYLLIFCSIISIAVIIERIVYYKRRSQYSRVDIFNQVRKEVTGNRVLNAIGLCKNIDTPVAKVALAGLNLHGHDEKLIANAMEREITVETIKLERFTGIIGSIGGTAVYIGLLGTVLGIMRAFNNIGKAGSGGMNVVTVGIAEALICTAAGLLVAIPAVLCYNWFTRKIDNFVVDMELAASELVDLLCSKKK